MPRSHASKVDANQAEIVDALRALGCSVQSLAAVGDGCPDLLCAIGGVNFLLEIKDGSGTFTDAQRRWHRDWRGRAHVVRTVADAQNVYSYYRQLGQAVLQKFMASLPRDAQV